MFQEYSGRLDEHQRGANPAMRVLICGSRTWTDTAAIQRTLEDLPPGPTTILHGGARAVSIRWPAGSPNASATRSRCTKRTGAWAGVPARNATSGCSTQSPDLVLAFWDGRSPPAGSPGKREVKKNCDSRQCVFVKFSTLMNASGSL